MTTPVLQCVKDPTTPTGAEQQYLVYSVQTPPTGDPVSQIVWRGTVTQLNAVAPRAAAMVADAQTKLALIAALPAS